jgi:hypothetical protein
MIEVETASLRRPAQHVRAVAQYAKDLDGGTDPSRERGPSRAHEGQRSEDRGCQRRYRAGNDRPLLVERLSPGLVRGQLGVDLFAVVVVIRQCRVDLRGS